MDICPFCGEEAVCCVREVWEELREIELDACCETNLEGWIDSIRCWSRCERTQWMLEETGLTVKDLLVRDGTLHWTLHYGLRLGPVSFADAKTFVARHHRHCDAPVGWKYGKAVFNGHEMVGVVMVGRPVSPALSAQGCIEINRVCVLDHRPHALVENACSMLYGFACREAFRRGYRRVITYTTQDERGTSLRAAGFRPVARSKGGSWNRKGRPRTDKSSTAPKIRWERWCDAAALPIQQRLVFESLADRPIAA